LKLAQGCLFGLITFLLLIGLLYKFAFNPLMRMRRRARIDHQAIHDAEPLRDEAQVARELQAAVERSSRGGHHHPSAPARRVVDKAEVLEEARVQAEATRKARQQIERDTTQALQNPRGRRPQLAATEKVPARASERISFAHTRSYQQIDLSKISENQGRRQDRKSLCYRPLSGRS
jgi:F0F1-type ATP synthase membrane subunit b/b'